MREFSWDFKCAILPCNGAFNTKYLVAGFQQQGIQQEGWAAKQYSFWPEIWDMRYEARWDCWERDSTALAPHRSCGVHTGTTLHNPSCTQGCPPLLSHICPCPTSTAIISEPLDGFEPTAIPSMDLTIAHHPSSKALFLQTIYMSYGIITIHLK